MNKDNPALVAFKIYIFPGLVSILGVMIWNDVSEIKADVKALMAQSNIDKTRIDNLEREVYKKPIANQPTKEERNPLENNKLYAVIPDNSFRIKKRVYEF